MRHAALHRRDRYLAMTVMDDTVPAGAPVGRTLSPDELERLVVEVLQRHSASLLRMARRHSLNADDAQDAYQRALEIFVRHAPRLDPERAPSWLRTVVKHEAMAVRRARLRDVPGAEYDFDAIESRTTPSPEERVIGFEHVARSAEALGALKPQEVRALWLQAQGSSYAEIERETGWTRTKVNRCLYEGRRAFLRRYAGIEAGEACARWEPLLSALVDGEASPDELAALRGHLRSCSACRAVVRELHRAATPLSVVFPAGAVLAAGAGAEPAGQVFVNVFGGVTTWLGERAASSVVRAQILVDGVLSSAGKATAVAAASAAVAGGGAVAVRQASQEERAARVAAVAPVGRAGAPAEARGSVRELTIAQEVERRLAAERRRAARARARRRAVAPPAAAAPAAAAPAARTGSAPAAVSTPGPAPAPAPAPAAAPTPAASAPAAPASPAASPGGGAGAELGLE